MDAAALVRTARKRSGLTIRQLAQRAHTSHSAIAAYETGTKTPGPTTLARVVRACGFEIEPRLRRVTPFENHVRRSREIVDVLDLADHLPSSHGPMISGRFPTG